MNEHKATTDRLGAFSDAVIAVIITIMVLELEAPEDATFSSLLPLWPTAISYAVSYLFIAIIWLNHHQAPLRWPHHTGSGVGELRPSFRRLAGAVRNGLDRAHASGGSAGGHLRRALRLREHCLSRVRAAGAAPGGRDAYDGTRKAHGEAPVFRNSVDLRERHAGSAFAPRAGFALICCALFPYLRPEAPGARL